MKIKGRVPEDSAFLFTTPYRPKVILAGHRPGLPGNVISFYIVPLDPAHRAGLAGHAPVTFF